MPIRLRLPNRFEHIESIAVLELQIQYHRIALHEPQCIDRILLGVARADDLHAGKHTERLDESLTQYRRVFHQEDPQWPVGEHSKRTVAIGGRLHYQRAG
jgi:hypothetical protein